LSFSGYLEDPIQQSLDIPVVPFQIDTWPRGPDLLFSLDRIEIIDEPHAGDPTLRADDHAASEGRVALAIFEGQTGTTTFDLTRCDGLHSDTEVMQTTGTGQSCRIAGLQYAFSIQQATPRMGHGEALDKILRCDAHPGSELTVEMIGTQPGDLRQLLQAGLLLIIFIQVLDDACHFL